MEHGRIICVFVAVIYFQGAESGPLHGHDHAHPADITGVQEWNITVNINSGKDDFPNWIVSPASENKNIKVIAKALDWYAHNIGVGKKLLNRGGYQGFTISHVIDGKDTGTNYLPACTLKNLEKALISYTAPASMKPYYKQLILCSLDHCGKRVPASCYKKTTTQDTATTPTAIV